jgi:MFS family permease
VGSGLLNGAFFSLGNVFADGVGFSEKGIATFMAATILGGAVFQWPVGHLSDRHDRRRVLFLICALSGAVAMAGYFMAQGNEMLLICLGVVYGGLSFTVYGLSVAHVNDLIDPSRILEVTGGLLLLYGLGATAGPTLAGGLMDQMGPEALMLYLAGVLAILVLAIWRYSIRTPTLIIDSHAIKSDYVVMGNSSPAVLQMDPRRQPTHPSTHAVAGEPSDAFRANP